VHRRYALGDPADPPPRRHFSKTPGTKYPVAGSETRESVVRKLGWLGGG